MQRLIYIIDSSGPWRPLVRHYCSMAAPPGLDPRPDLVFACVQIFNVKDFKNSSCPAVTVSAASHEGVQIRVQYRRRECGLLVGGPTA